MGVERFGRNRDEGRGVVVRGMSECIINFPCGSHVMGGDVKNA